MGGTAPPFDLANYDAFVFDLDGTVWLGATEPIAGAAEFLESCRERGIRIVYATNAIVHSPDELSDRLVAAGLAEPDEPVVTTGLVITRTLVSDGVEHVAGVIPPALVESLTGVDIEIVSPNDVDPNDFGPVGTPRALVMASFREATIGAIERLGRLAVAGHRLYLSSAEPGFPVAGGIEPGGGVLFAALSAMYDVDPILLGKPSQQYADVLAQVVAQTVGRPDPRIAMFGDSQRADIGIAHLLDCHGIFLDRYAIKELDPDVCRPTYVAPTLADSFVAYAP